MKDVTTTVTKWLGLALAAALTTCAVAGMAGCHKFSVNDVETTPAVVRLDGTQAVAGSITKDLIISAVEGEEAGVVATFARGDEVAYLGMSEEGLAGIRVGEGDEAVVGLVDPKFLWLEGQERYTEHTAYAYLGASSFADFALTAGEEPLAVDAAVTVYDEIDGVLIVRDADDASDRYMRPWGLDAAASTWTSRVDLAEVYAAILSRDDTVTILGEATVGGTDYYVVSFPAEREGARGTNATGEEFPALVPKWLVRTAQESAPEGREGYAVYNAAVFSNAFMASGIAYPAVDTVIKVLDEFAGVAYVELPDGTRSYMPAENVTDTTNYVAPRRGGGGGGGGGGSTPAPSTGNDGEDISLMAYRLGATVSQAVYSPGKAVVATGNYVMGTGHGSKAAYVAGEGSNIWGATTDAVAAGTEGTILSADTPVFWGFLDRGDAIHVAEVVADDGGEGDGTLWVQLAGRAGWMEENLMRENSAPAFAAQDLYTDNEARIYSDHHRDEVAVLADRNDVIHVVDEYGEGLGGYVIEVPGEGGAAPTYRYIDKSVASDTEYAAPAPRYYGGGGGGGGSSSGGGGGQTLEWTEPVM